MVEVGQKVVYVGGDFPFWENRPEVLVVKNVDKSGRFISLVGHPRNGLSARDYTKDWYILANLFKPYTETEAERRGAKFGVKGVVRQDNVAVIFISDKQKENALGETLWTVVNEDGIVSFVHPGNIHLDHEPEYVAWSEAPEHLRYDSSRVYYDGKPVKWIAKPEGASISVVYVGYDGWVRNGGIALTVKL